MPPQINLSGLPDEIDLSELPDEIDLSVLPDEDEEPIFGSSPALPEEPDSLLDRTKDIGGNIWDFATTSVVPGLTEPSMEEWVENPKDSAIRSLGMGLTTPLAIAAELGGAGFAALRGLRRLAPKKVPLEVPSKIDVPEPRKPRLTEPILDEGGRPLAPPQRIIEERPPGPWDEMNVFRENKLNIKDGTLDVPTASNPVDKLASALQETKPLTKQQADILTSERAEKIAKARGIDITDEESANKFLGMLKGEHTKVKNVPLELQDSDITELYKIIGKYPDRDGFRKGRGIVALRKLLEGEVLQENEIEVMEDIFGLKIPKGYKGKRLIHETLNLPRAIMASVDLPPFRQGLPSILTKAWWTSWDDMLKSYGSKKAFQGVMRGIKEDPLFEMAEESGVTFTDLLGKREETFARSSLARHIPLIKGSERAHVAFLNKLRLDQFKSMVKDQVNSALQPGLNPADSNRINPYKNKAIREAIGKYVNDATGRGGLGKLEKSAETLNEVFFSPRLMASRVRMWNRYINPNSYSKVPASVRKQTLKSLIGTAGTWISTAGIAKMAGADVSMDTNNPDFGKIKIGNTRIDPAGGFQQFLVAVSRLISGLSTSSVSGNQEIMGEGYRATTRKDIGERFLTSKLNPTVAFVYDLLSASQQRPVNVGDRTVRMFIPLIVQDILEIMEEDPDLLPALIPTTVGMGSQTYGGEKESTIIPEEFDITLEGGSPFR